MHVFWLVKKILVFTDICVIMLTIFCKNQQYFAILRRYIKGFQLFTEKIFTIVNLLKRKQCNS